LHEGELGAADAQQLLEQHFREMRACSPPSACHVLALADLAAPEISFWSLRESGRLLGVGALKQVEPGHGEIKSMRTADEARGRGAGARMLDHLLDLARRRGDRRVSLETGRTQEFAAAIRLYRRRGFQPCGPFAGYRETPFTLFFSLPL
jgi:putative acetyltransferase